MSPKTSVGKRARQPRRTTRLAKCPLPHERDEVPDNHGSREHLEITLAERDLREGRVDTDNYTRAREAFRRRR